MEKKPTAHVVTREEQREMGLLPEPRQNFVPAVRETKRAEIVPARLTLPELPTGGIEQRVTYTSDPESRARAVALKATQVTIALSILTGMAMLMLQEWTFILWLLLASAEWVACFVMLNVLDYRETPMYNARKTTDRLLDMMEREHLAQLQAHYPEQRFLE